VESISHITAETLYDCHKAFYTPSNMVLTVVGNVDPIHVLDLARRILPREGGPVIPRDYGAEPESVAQRETKLAMEVSCPQFLTGFKCAPAADGEDYMRQSLIGDMACDILLGDSSPLYLRLYDQGLINTSFGGAYEMMPGVAYLYAGGDSKDARAVQSAILEEAARLVDQGIDEEFYQRVRRAAFGSNLRGLNSFENIAVSLSEGYFHSYDPLRFPQVFDSIAKEDIRTFLRDNITGDRAVLSEIVPK
jgi:predicted Zn-dependent peptidase